MDMEQHLRRGQIASIPLGNHGFSVSSEKWKSLSSGDEIENDQSGGGFECNICLDLVQDPVVTFCGHLYCWPCIYKWINSLTACSEDSENHPQQPQCPVCKAEVSEKTLIPLYGRGLATTPSKLNGAIPQRPPSPRYGTHMLVPSGTHQPQHIHRRSHPPPTQQHRAYPPPMLNLSGTTTVMNHPMIGMIGEMVYARMSRNSGEAGYYAYPNSYQLAAVGNSPRLRRQMVEADTSLGRMCFFLFCCVVLCLLLF